MAIHLARRIWMTLEPLHDVVYFDAEVKQAGVAVGLRGYWQTYFAFRAAPPGAVTAGTVSQDAVTEVTYALAPLVKRVQESVVPPINPVGMGQG
jgi:hypothetical protein